MQGVERQCRERERQGERERGEREREKYKRIKNAVREGKGKGERKRTPDLEKKVMPRHKVAILKLMIATKNEKNIRKKKERNCNHFLNY